MPWVGKFGKINKRGGWGGVGGDMIYISAIIPIIPVQSLSASFDIFKKKYFGSQSFRWTVLRKLIPRICTSHDFAELDGGINLCL